MHEKAAVTVDHLLAFLIFSSRILSLLDFFSLSLSVIPAAKIIFKKKHFSCVCAVCTCSCAFVCPLTVSRAHLLHLLPWKQWNRVGMGFRRPHLPNSDRFWLSSSASESFLRAEGHVVGSLRCTRWCWKKPNRTTTSPGVVL